MPYHCFRCLEKEDQGKAPCITLAFSYVLVPSIHLYPSTYNLLFFTDFHKLSSSIILCFSHTVNHALNLLMKFRFYCTVLATLLVSHCYQSSYILPIQVTRPLSSLRTSRLLANKCGYLLTSSNMSGKERENFPVVVDMVEYECDPDNSRFCRTRRPQVDRNKYIYIHIQGDEIRPSGQGSKAVALEFQWKGMDPSWDYGTRITSDNGSR